jgi:chromate transporter
MTSSTANEDGCSTAELLTYFLRLGTFGFGGPIALAGRMQRDLVEERRWISREDYLEGLAFSQLSPGPLAAQLAMYIGWVNGGRVGAALVAAAFILPSFIMAVLVAAAYVRFGQLAWIHEAFYGIGAAVIAIIAQSALRLSRKTIGKDPFLWAVFITVAVTTVWTGSEVVWLFVGCGLLSIAWQMRRQVVGSSILPSFVGILPWLFTGTQGPATAGVLVSLGLFFLKAGSFVFGSGLAIVPFLYGGV